MTLLPGVRLTASKSGFGVSIGGPLGRVGVGPRGFYISGSLPGTGISFHQSLAPFPPSAGSPLPVQPTQLPAPRGEFGDMPPEDIARALGRVEIVFKPDGDIVWQDHAGEELPWDVSAWIMSSQADRWSTVIATRVDEMNAELRLLATVHHQTPLSGPVQFRPRAFDVPSPERPVTENEGLLARFAPWRQAQRQEAAISAARQYEEALAEHERQRAEHERVEAIRFDVYARAQRGDPEAILASLENSLAEVLWLRPTLVRCHASEDASVLHLEVDLPEIEDMPRVHAAPSASGHRIRYVPMPQTDRLQLHSDHVLGIVCRLHGEVFATSPTIERVVISGFTQRVRRGDAEPTDTFIVSVLCKRTEWARLSADALGGLDLVSWVRNCGGRIDPTPTGRFRSIDPLAVS